MLSAVKLSEKGGDVELYAEVDSGQVRIEVEDYGRGIPPEHRDLVFEKFMHVGSSDTREKGGTSLRLSIAKAIVESHRGQINF